MQPCREPELSPVNVFVEALRVIRTTAAAWSVRLLPSADRARDAYFASASDHVDLENRIRSWERRPAPFWDRV